MESAPNAPRDPRIDSVTIEQLLVHSGGWDSATTKSDPQYLPATLLASYTLNAENPAEASTIVRFMQDQPLDFDPGTQSAYSNFGFDVLGRVIEHISGMGYEQYVDQYVLSPAGITSMAIGGTTLAERLADEVRYYWRGLPRWPLFTWARDTFPPAMVRITYDHSIHTVDGFQRRPI